MAEYEMVKIFNLAAAPPDIQAVDALQVLKELGEDIGSLLEVRVGQNTMATGNHATLLLDRWMLDEGAEVGETVFLVWNATTMANPATMARLS